MAVIAAFGGGASRRKDKKTDDLKPADPDTGESTVEEATLGLLPNPFEKQGVKFAMTYIGEGLGNPTGGQKQSAVYEDRINFAADVDFEKLVGLKQLTFHANVFQIDGGGLSRGAPELSGRQRHRGAADDPTLRNLVRAEMGDKFALRAGQLAADTEFMTAKYTDVFTNASLGWPAGLPSICRAGDRRRRLRRCAGRLLTRRLATRDRGDRGALRRRQDDRAVAAAALLRSRRGPRLRRWCGRARDRARAAAIACLRRVPGRLPVLRHGLRQRSPVGRPGATPDEVRRALRLANAAEFVEALPAGADSVIGDRGLTLSGGQRQRLAIARALVKDAPIVVLDEATSSVDVEGEGIVQECASIKRVRAGRTTLVIAHRLSTVRSADRIVVLDAGRAVELGGHAQLITAGGAYAQLVARQDGVA